jgi:hypothetical protein
MRALPCTILAAAVLSAGAAVAAADDAMGDMAPYPDLAHASRAEVAQARRLWHGTLVSARRRFPSYAAARARGYVRDHRRWTRPLVFHLRKRAFDTDGALLDARRPEALVYWWPAHGRPVLLGFMYRVPAGRPPAFGGAILAYHGHMAGGHMGATQMTHVWLTRGLRTAYARCLPVAALERAIPAFQYATPGHSPSGPEAEPCKEMTS